MVSTNSEFPNSIESFIVGLQAQFMTTPDRDKILERIGNLVAFRELASSDDGISQTMTAKAGIQQREDVKVPNPVVLKPYRTFPDIDQPESKFVFRLHNIQDNVACSLHEADGGMWKIEAMENIQTYLKETLPDYLIMA